MWSSEQLPLRFDSHGSFYEVCLALPNKWKVSCRQINNDLIQGYGFYDSITMNKQGAKCQQFFWSKIDLNTGFKFLIAWYKIISFLLKYITWKWKKNLKHAHIISERQPVPPQTSYTRTNNDATCYSNSFCSLADHHNCLLPDVHLAAVRKYVYLE